MLQSLQETKVTIEKQEENSETQHTELLKKSATIQQLRSNCIKKEDEILFVQNLLIEISTSLQVCRKYYFNNENYF